MKAVDKYDHPWLEIFGFGRQTTRIGSNIAQEQGTKNYDRATQNEPLPDVRHQVGRCSFKISAFRRIAMKVCHGERPMGGSASCFAGGLPPTGHPRRLVSGLEQRFWSEKSLPEVSTASGIVPDAQPSI
jgi:hypothetical protein